MASRLTPAATAALLVLSVRALGKEKGKDVNRGFISRKAILELSGRLSLTDAFMNEVRNTAAELGWTLADVDSSYALFETASAKQWTPISMKRVDDLAEGLRAGRIADDVVLERALAAEAGIATTG